MDELINAILRLGSAALATEEAACGALVEIRFPDGITCRCGSVCTRTGARVRCAHGHRFTILVDTPFGSKTAPRVRALFLAIRAFALSSRSISARELARDVGAPASTIWRHLLTLRALMPRPHAEPIADAASVQLCGRRTTASPAWVRATIPSALARARTAPPRVTNNIERLIGESVRTFVNGTFHGVSARWLSAYLEEARTRWRYGDGFTAACLVERLCATTSSLTFQDVRAHFAAVA